MLSNLREILVFLCKIGKTDPDLKLIGYYWTQGEFCHIVRLRLQSTEH